MNRVTIHETDDYGDTRTTWFNLDAVTEAVQEPKEWNGDNMVGLCSGLQTSLACLYRTAGGRWVLHEDRSNEFNGPDSWQWLTDKEAQEWLIKCDSSHRENGAAEVLGRHFADTPDESGPNPKGGRPAVGPAISVAYPRDLLDRIEAAADTAGISRAAWLRQAAEDKLIANGQH